MMHNIKPSSTLSQPSQGAPRNWKLGNIDVITLTNVVETPTPHLSCLILRF
jgi:hypothetical protein